METKILEVRDKATFLPVVAINMNPNPAMSYDFADYLLRRTGYTCDGRPVILLVRATGGAASYDPHSWGDRTMATAHRVILARWATLKDGDVVDVEFELGESNTHKTSERHGF